MRQSHEGQMRVPLSGDVSREKEPPESLTGSFMSVMPIMSILSAPNPEKGRWVLILRIRVGDIGQAVEDMKKAGIRVIDVT